MKTFWDIFADLCYTNGTKPSPVLSELGLSTGNISRWQKGGDVKSGILLQISEKFNVSVDYLLTGKEFLQDADAQSCVSDEEIQFIKMYRALPESTRTFVYGSVKQGYDNEMRRIEEEKKLS